VARSQEQRKSETRARLIDAAADLFARKGFHAVSAEAVAAAADRTTGALYSHFGGKEGLLLALLEVWKERTADDLRDLHDVLAGQADMDAHLAAIWSSIVDPRADRSDAWLLLELELWLHGVRDPVISALLAQRYTEIRAQLGEGLADWAAATGATLPRPPEETGALVLGLLLGCALQHRLEPAALQERLVVDGLRTLMGLPTPGEDT
jgi:AcrR family transcriptional regulator